eukprot:1633970-Amphidinium_carterae.3
MCPHFDAVGKDFLKPFCTEKPTIQRDIPRTEGQGKVLDKRDTTLELLLFVAAGAVTHEDEPHRRLFHAQLAVVMGRGSMSQDDAKQRKRSAKAARQSSSGFQPCGAGHTSLAGSANVVCLVCVCDIPALDLGFSSSKEVVYIVFR